MDFFNGLCGLLQHIAWTSDSGILNDRVNKGQPIVCFDKEMIEEKGYNMITMMIVVNDERISKLEKGDQLDKLLIKVQCK